MCTTNIIIQLYYVNFMIFKRSVLSYVRALMSPRHLNMRARSRFSLNIIPPHASVVAGVWHQQIEFQFRFLFFIIIHFITYIYTYSQYLQHVYLAIVHGYTAQRSHPVLLAAQTSRNICTSVTLVWLLAVVCVCVCVQKSDCCLL